MDNEKNNIQNDNNALSPEKHTNPSPGWGRGGGGAPLGPV